MDKVIDQERFKQELFDLLSETFGSHHGIYLDEGTSLFETLGTIRADEASRPVGGKCATLAAQVAHVAYCLEVLDRYILNGNARDVDWGEIWRTVREVSAEQWENLKLNSETTYRRVFAMLQNLDTWDSGGSLRGAMAIVVHSAYHLGVIRQALCTLK